MKYLKRECQKRPIFMNMCKRRVTIPEVLKKKLIMNGCLILCILAAGIFMEWNNSGEGFFKLTIFCAIGLLCRLLCFLQIVIKKKYKLIEGEVVRIEISKKRRKYWDVTIQTVEGENILFHLPVQSEVHKGLCYRFYRKNGELLGVEEK